MASTPVNLTFLMLDRNTAAHALALFELSWDCSIDDLKSAYRELLLVWHPDRHQSNARLRDRADRKTQEINRSHELLKDWVQSPLERRREIYFGSSAKDTFSCVAGPRCHAQSARRSPRGVTSGWIQAALPVGRIHVLDAIVRLTFIVTPALFGMILLSDAGFQVIGVLLLAFSYWMAFVIASKRVHDIGFPAVLAAVGSIVVAFIPLLALALLWPGARTKNRWGSPPRLFQEFRS